MRLLDLTSQINDNLSEDRKLHDGPVNVYSYETFQGKRFDWTVPFDKRNCLTSLFDRQSDLMFDLDGTWS